MNLLKDKVAVVFAANGTISRAVAEAFAAAGARVYLAARRKEDLTDIVRQMNAAGGFAEAAIVDALDENQMDAFLSSVMAREGRLNIVFNGIGVRPSESGYSERTTDISFEQFMKPVYAHLGSQFLSSRLSAKHMMAHGCRGTILALSASLSRLKLPFMSGVSAACAAIEGLSRVMAAEFGAMGIRVICMNATAMGETRTIQETGAANAKTLGLSPEEFARASSMNGSLLKQPLTVQDLAKAAVLLASDAGAVFNSHVVDIDFGTGSVI